MSERLLKLSVRVDISNNKRINSWKTCRICFKTGHWEPGKPEICEHRERFEGLLPEDLIERYYDPSDNYNWKLYKPYILCLHGTGCGGYYSICTGEKEINGKKFPMYVLDPELAWMLALLVWVDDYRRYDNGSPLRNLCTCDKKLTELKQKINTMGVEIGKWEAIGGIPHRGITDYELFVRPSHTLTEEEEHVLEEYISIYNNPGYCNKTVKKVAGVYKFTSTMDSSD